MLSGMKQSIVFVKTIGCFCVTTIMIFHNSKAFTKMKMQNATHTNFCVKTLKNNVQLKVLLHNPILIISFVTWSFNPVILGLEEYLHKNNIK